MSNLIEEYGLIMLVPVLAASALTIPARRSYPIDVATADASAQGDRGGVNEEDAISARLD